MRTLIVVMALGSVACMDTGYDRQSVPSYPQPVLSDRQREIAGERADLPQLLAALESIEAFHAENRTGLELQPPLGKAALEEALAEFPCKVPDELRALWAWRNGEVTDKFIWYHRFLPVQDAIEQYKMLAAEPVPGWSRDWIPIFEFQEEWYAVECSPEPTPGAPVIHYFVEDDPKQAYVNLTVYMKVMSEAMREGALRWKSEWWEDDLRSLARIHARLNPEIGFPYHVP